MDNPTKMPLGVSQNEKVESRDCKYQQEIAWMAALRTGDEEAFLQLYRLYGEHVLAVCLRILHDRHVAEDVLSEIFWEIWRHPERYDSSRSTPQTYLLMVARSRAIDRLRELSRRAKVIVDAGAAQLADGKITLQDLPETSANRQEEKKLVLAAVDCLDANQRQVLELAFFQGLSHQQIAEHLNHPLGTVKSRIRQALIHLRTKLSSAFPERFQS
jgi:RNA polymerase sigma-70 factor, ECF subfamily